MERLGGGRGRVKIPSHHGDQRLRRVRAHPRLPHHCAILADIKRDYVRAHLSKFADGAAMVRRLAGLFRELESEASRWIDTKSNTAGRMGFTASLDPRYQGQAFDLQVAISDLLRRKPNAATIGELFHREHEKVYGFREPETPIEITTVRLRVTGKILPIRLPTVPSGEAARPRGNRQVYYRGRHLVAPIYDRSDLGLEDRIKESAIVEQEATTVWALPGWAASVDRIGNLVLGPDVGAKLSKPNRRRTTMKAGGRPRRFRCRKENPLTPGGVRGHDPEISRARSVHFISMIRITTLAPWTPLFMPGVSRFGQ
jgi:hypothetical protein